MFRSDHSRRMGTLKNARRCSNMESFSSPSGRHSSHEKKTLEV